MTTGKTTNIKSLLRGECPPALNQSAAYFSMADVLAWLQQRGLACPPPVLLAPDNAYPQQAFLLASKNIISQ